MIGNEWDELLKDEFQKDYFLKLQAFLDEEYEAKTIYPPRADIYNALRFTPYKDVKVVLLGQDPYHGPGQAHGMCFSVRPGVAVPPSLQNMFKELQTDTGMRPPKCGTLTSWARQGVLLMNTVLTVREHQANSHKGKGWEKFTDKVISLLNERDTPMVFLLWGANSRSKKAIITNPDHLILEAPHPSPLSAYNGFFGCRHFSKANDFLHEHGIEPINWNSLNTEEPEA